MPNDHLLLEIGSEELPPKSLRQLMLSLESNLSEQLGSAGFSFSTTRSYATPRRLAVLIEDLADKQSDQQIEKRGPAVSAAYDDKGEPTKALLGFARSCGVEDPASLERLSSEKGEWVLYRGVQEGKCLQDEIEQLVANSVANLPIDRNMRWGSKRLEFARPVHWVALIYGSEILPANILGKETGRASRGHRFMSDGEIAIQNAKDYPATLEKASVIVDFEQRKQEIVKQLEDQASSLEANLELDESLLDEVTALVEFPCVLSGSFGADFLEIPEEALISAMKKHQRYFHLTNDKDKLLANFITVSNILSKDSSIVIAGNERVIRPRLADAVFFFRKDSATTMVEKLTRLQSVVFQSELGTFYEKAERVSKLAGSIAKESQIDEVASTRAGLLCKADLVSEMVNEFPDLQGTMGGYYAANDGEDEAVCNAIRQHYMPIFSGAGLPSNPVASCVALADKLDTVVGLFAVGQPPSGSRDPFGLRRQTLGIIRICIENKLSLDIQGILQTALDLHQRTSSPGNVFDYILDRLENWYGEQGIDQDVFNSVRYSHAGITDLLEADYRIHSVQAFRQHQQAANLIEANKRVANILKKATFDILESPDPSLFKELSEENLADHVKSIQQKFAEGSLNYEEKFLQLAQLQPHVDKYFDDVMVMADDRDLKDNRLAALAELRIIFLEVADFSLLQS
ncbi:MAG: glycine--tRNA ligase subunit beta [Gammaproteobacteria bacterium]|nr:glycine--tRNA ligase subunit beta [Gammaproteobacteria bacterium]